MGYPSSQIRAAEGLISWSYHGDDDDDLEKLEDHEEDQEKGQIEGEDQKTPGSIIDIPDDVDEEMPIAKRKHTSSAKGKGKGKVKKLPTMLKKSMEKKEKPSTIKKTQKKNQEKTGADKIIPASANQKKIDEKKKEDQKKLQDEQEKKKGDQKGDEPWKQDLIKSEDGRPGTISALADLPKNVRVISEAAGKRNFWKRRTMHKHQQGSSLRNHHSIRHSLCIS